MRNDVTSFFYYMWNMWSKEESVMLFGEWLGTHFWDKWTYYFKLRASCAIDNLYAGMEPKYRDMLVARALECYDGENRIQD